MTVLSASQQAIMKLVGQKPASVVSSTDEICVEMTALAQEAAVDIAKSHDWQNLTEFYTVTANGTDSTYPFPSDYDRMVQASEFYDPNNWCWGYCHITDYGEWLQMTNRGIGMLTPGAWTIRKNQFHFLPTPAAGQEAVFPYVSKNIWTSANGNPKAAVTSDGDTFALDERILTLALIWKWLSLKRMDYQQEFVDFELALSQKQTRDKGARTIHSGRSRPLRGMNIGPAWPWPLG